MKYFILFLPCFSFTFKPQFKVKLIGNDIDSLPVYSHRQSIDLYGPKIRLYRFSIQFSTFSTIHTRFSWTNFYLQIVQFSAGRERQIEMHNFMTNLLKNDWTMSTTQQQHLHVHPFCIYILVYTYRCTSSMAQEVGNALGHAGILGPKTKTEGERGDKCDIDKAYARQIKYNGDLPYLFCSPYSLCRRPDKTFEKTIK